MVIRPVAPPHLLTAAEYLEIGEIEPGYSELVEGRLLMSPTRAPEHSAAEVELAFQLRPFLPADVKVIPNLDIDLQLAPADARARSGAPT